LITIPNDRLVKIANPNNPINSVLGMADDLLIKGIQGITEILNNRGLMRIDFSHISQLMKNSGGAYISIGNGHGDNRIKSAIDNALNHPLVENTPLHQAKGIILKISGNLMVNDVDFAISYLRDLIDPKVEILPVVEQVDLKDDQVMISILLTGLGATPLPGFPSHKPESGSTTEQQPLLSKSRKTKLLKHSVQEHEDVLEIPAFIRKGYNLDRQY
jgi:cell division protein FtsZ